MLLVPLAMPLLGEELTPPADWVLCDLLGIVSMNLIANRRGGARARENRRGLMFALLTGLIITTYSIIDKAGVAHTNPLIYVYIEIGIQRSVSRHTC